MSGRGTAEPVLVLCKTNSIFTRKLRAAKGSFGRAVGKLELCSRGNGRACAGGLREQGRRPCVIASR